MGSAYADALGLDLDTVAAALGPNDRVSVLTTGLRRPEAVQYSGQLAGGLRCTLGSLNARLFEALADDATEHGFKRDRIQRWVDRWKSGTGLLKPIRRTASDDEIRSSIEILRRVSPGVAEASALKAVRTSGIACSQERFRALFRSGPRLRPDGLVA
jgi:hypothetical protein